MIYTHLSRLALSGLTGTGRTGHVHGEDQVQHAGSSLTGGADLAAVESVGLGTSQGAALHWHCGDGAPARSFALSGGEIPLLGGSIVFVVIIAETTLGVDLGGVGRDERRGGDDECDGESHCFWGRRYNVVGRFDRDDLHLEVPRGDFQMVATNEL